MSCVVLCCEKKKRIKGGLGGLRGGRVVITFCVVALWCVGVFSAKKGGTLKDA